ncbi:hypothetical protein [Xenorhabdus griffiniae]|uniref:Uncharacterized protein n=1 Tax=Xenorhabdus griffiniae TaxID=351672 RepID=A0ABY9XF10_9GAMM|nr:hypothetical protein [Xenorhabdus griffiniae]MBD1228838.1 hypothetical protein [Xenorhabdus griffiniae]MBE8588267.1 hypothetical protein [Xenorhabdus griffiniae]WMV71505.1 hypothetical protein QL128_15295 [Xenorhabdus griffiniae]WNH01182.1 hypothetical protein QL112_015300 [Xenorhabdus griffiniae]
MFNNQRPGNTTPPQDYYSELGWMRKQLSYLPVGTILNHGNSSGTDGGAGQSGISGSAIWLTSENDRNAAFAYSQRTYLLQYEVISKLTLAVFDELSNQVFPDELALWDRARREYNLDGVLTYYEMSQEICLFDRSKIRIKNQVRF